MAGRSLFIDAVVVYLHPADYSASPLYWYMDSLSVAADPGKSLARPIVGKNGTVAGEAGAADLLKSLIIDPLDQSTFPHWKATRGAGLALSKYLPGETRPGTLQGEVVPDDWFFKLSFGSSLRENEGYSGVKLSVDKPLALPGINKTISAWVRSQSSRVKVYFVVQDLRGFEYELLAGIIDGSGEMKRLTVAVPPWPSLYQKDGRISDRIGLSFIGFDFVPPSSESGSIDIYLLSVVTDTFQSPRDPDWVQGGW